MEERWREREIEKKRSDNEPCRGNDMAVTLKATHMSGDGGDVDGMSAMAVLMRSSLAACHTE